jgi:hypothetical protein
MRGYPEDGCVVAVRGGRGERKQNTPVENGVTARSVGGLMRAINIEAAAQHRQGSTCKVVNEGLSGSSDWLNSRQKPVKPPSSKARINSCQSMASHNDSHSSYSQRQDVSRVTLISAAGRSWEQNSTAMVMNHFPFPRRSFARGRCCCRKMPATNLIFHLNHIPSHDENRDTTWPIISQIILLPVSILCEPGRLILFDFCGPVENV